MTLKDKRGNPLSPCAPAALAGLERAADLFHGYRVDPLAAIDETLAEHPDLVMGHCLRAGLIATATDRAFEPELARSVAAAEALWERANERERGHIAACRAWLDGDFERATDLWGRVSLEHPRDLIALQLAHLGDFYNGFSLTLRDRVARVLRAWSPAVPGYGYLLGMYAFGLEEAGNYRKAEAIGRQAVDIDARDGWAVHAVTHVMEMEGRTAAGVDWLTGSSDQWAPENMFAFHNWWHLALFHLERGETERVLALYDQAIRPSDSDNVLELIDAAALLWRLGIAGCDVGARWTPLADRFATRIAHGVYAFNDVHAMMCFIGAGRDADADAQLATLERRARGSERSGTGSVDSNAMMSREVGLPLAQALRAFARGDHAAVIDRLLPLRNKAQRFGGSHAQRDVIAWTLLEAALRSGAGDLAQALAAERLELRPESPHNRWWWKRASAAMARAA